MQHDSAPAASPSPGQRHYGLDWLRIAAFGLLILYHIGMVFAPWGWVIKSSHVYTALIPPMALLTPWRLPLLFAVSGYASAKLLARSEGPRGFAASRNARLLIPLAFGMAALVPIEMWIRVSERGYPGSYLQFWLGDYWRAGEFYGREFPSWEHLWFVAYLWAYTMVLVALVAWGGARIGRASERLVAWLSQRRRVLWAPIAMLAVAKLALMFVVAEHQGLFSDWSGHALFLPVFLFGFGMARAPALWPALARSWQPALAIAAAAGAVVVAVELSYPGEAIPPHALMAADRAGRVAMAWSMVLASFQLADRYWNRDHRWRRTLAEAVFPFYLFHHPAIILIAWWTLPLGLSAPAEFLLLVAGAMGVCTLVYLAGREIPLLRPLIGLGPSKPRTVAPAAAEGDAVGEGDREVAAAVGLDAADRLAPHQPPAMDAHEARP